MKYHHRVARSGTGPSGLAAFQGHVTTTFENSTPFIYDIATSGVTSLTNIKQTMPDFCVSYGDAIGFTMKKSGPDSFIRGEL